MEQIKKGNIPGRYDHIMSMSDRRRFTSLAVVMILTSVVLMASAVYLFYRLSVQQWRNWLVDAVHKEACIIQAVAAQGQVVAHHDPSYDWKLATVAQIAHAQEHFKGFGRTGEMVLAWRDGNEVRFVLRRQIPTGSDDYPFNVVPFGGPLAQPMQLALQGKAGWIEGIDYQGHDVLAAYEPVPETPWAVVDKIDAAEMRAPFLKYGGMCIIAACIVLPAGFLTFRRITAPIVKSLEESAMRMESILLSAAEGICELDNQGRVLFANPAALAMLGWNSEELIGKDAHAVFHEHRDDSAHPAPQCPLKATLSDGQPHRASDETFYRKDGGRIHVDCMTACKRSRGKALGVVMTFSDVTARVVAENKLQETYEDLQEKNHEMEQFIYMVSHDLKSPLVTVQGFASHIKKDIAVQRTDRVEDFLARIQNAMERMKALIDGLLDLSRVGRVVAPAVGLDVGGVLQQLAERHRVLLESKHIELEIQPDMPSVCGDPLRIEQAFENLLLNAIKYGSSADQPVISIGCVQRDKELCYFVRDNGEGIEPQYHERVFQLFQKLTADKESTGVGLAIVRRVMEIHGGRAWVESIPGQGATFWLSLPLKSQFKAKSLAAVPQGGNNAGFQLETHAVSVD